MKIAARKLRPLYPFQEPALQYAIPRDKISLFMEMRLGKSVVTLRWIRLRKLRPNLIICPLTVIPNWEDECRAEGLSCSVLRGTERQIEETLRDDATVSLVNYDLVYRRDCIARHPWRSVVLDESTVIRNPKSKVSKWLCKAFPKTETRVILSGQARPNSTLDYFQQFKFLAGSWLGSNNYWNFRDKHYNPDYMGYEWEPHPTILKRIHGFLNDETFRLTRAQANIGSSKVYEKRFVDLPPKLVKVYNAAINEFILGEDETKWAPVVQGFCRQLCGGAVEGYESNHKLNELENLIRGELNGERMVIWAFYRAELQAIADRLKRIKRDGRYLRIGLIHGKIPLYERRGILRQLAKGNLDTVVSQMRCARFGLNMSKCDTAIYYSNSWDPEDRSQSEDRIIHADKTHPVLILDLVTRHTVEEEIVTVLQTKKLNAKSFMARLKARVRKGLC